MKIPLIGVVLVLAALDSRAGIKVFAEKNCTGEALEIDRAVPDLRELDFDDRISSLNADESWLVCSAPKFKGDCREVVGELTSLREEGLNERISSLRPVKAKGSKTKTESGNGEKKPQSEKSEKSDKTAKNESEPAWWGGGSEAAPFAEVARRGGHGRARIRLFEERDFGGRGLRFDRAVAELPPGSIRSVLVENGPWQVCTAPDFGGDCRILREGIVDLDDWADRIVSVRPAPPE